MINNLNKARLLLGALLLIATAALAEPKVSASCSKRQLGMDESLRYTIKVENAKNATEPRLGNLDGLGVLFGPSTSRNVSIVNGVQSSSIEYSYELRPLKTGEVKIGEGSIDVDGETYKLREIKIAVTAARPATKEEPAARDLGGEIFLELDISKTNVFIGEQLFLTATLYYRNVNLASVGAFQMELDGFNSQDVGRAQQDRQRYRGQYYEFVRMQKLLIPLRAGVLTIGPASSEVTVNIPISRGRSRDPFDDPFGMFQRYQSVDRVITSKPLKVTVSQLPAQGKPQDFKGAIGRFGLEVEEPKTEVKEGEPITLKATLVGIGNIEQAFLNLATTNLPDFKVYDPEVEKATEIRDGRLQGRKTYSQMWIPVTPGETEIPPVTFSYFDTEKNSYVTLKKGPFPIKVLKSENSQKLIVSEATPTATKAGGSTIKILSQDIFGVKSSASQSAPKAFADFRVLLAILLAPVILYLIFLLLFLYFSRHEDPGVKRARNAYKNAQEALKKAARLKGKKEAVGDFCGFLTAALTGYVADLNNVPASSVDANYLRSLNLPEEIVITFRALISEIEMARFSGLSGNVADNEKLLTESARLLKDLRRNLK